MAENRLSITDPQYPDSLTFIESLQYLFSFSKIQVFMRSPKKFGCFCVCFYKKFGYICVVFNKKIGSFCVVFAEKFGYICENTILINEIFEANLTN